MTTQLLILSFAAVVLLYWFRYNCLAILRATPPAGRAEQVAEANRLGFQEVRRRLQGQLSTDELDALHGSLNRDYRVLTSLLRYTSGFRTGNYTFEQRMLMLDFRLMSVWYAVTRRHVAPQARRSLLERSHILAHFANAIAERTAIRARA
jgi:hypothetical protein